MAQLDERLLDVNQHGVLRIPGEIWLVLLFLCRHWVLLLLGLVSFIVGQNTAATIFHAGVWWALLAQLPAVLACVLCLRRRPDAQPWVRILWPWTRLAMLSTSWLNMAYAAWFLYRTAYWLPWPELFVASCALLDLAVAYALLTSSYWRRVLAEFPPRSDSQQAVELNVVEN